MKTSYKIKKGIIAEKTKSKTIIFDGEKSELITLNSTASFIFELLKRGQKKESIVEELRKKFKLKNEDINKDFDDLIKELVEHRIISK